MNINPPSITQRKAKIRRLSPALLSPATILFPRYSSTIRKAITETATANLDMRQFVSAKKMALFELSLKTCRVQIGLV
jgi:hypothetical protein